MHEYINGILDITQATIGFHYIREGLIQVPPKVQKQVRGIHFFL